MEMLSLMAKEVEKKEHLNSNKENREVRSSIRQKAEIETER